VKKQPDKFYPGAEYYTSNGEAFVVIQVRPRSLLCIDAEGNKVSKRIQQPKTAWINCKIATKYL